MFLIEEVVVVSLDRVPRWVWDRVISGQVSLIVNGFEEDDSTADDCDDGEEASRVGLQYPMHLISCPRQRE